MAKKWLAVIRGNNFTVAQVAVRTNKEIKINFLAKYPGKIPMTIEIDEAGTQELKELKKWLQRLNIPFKKLKVAISSIGLITKVIDLPQMSNYDLENLLNNDIDQYLNIHVSNYLIDYRILKKYWENDKPMYKVLLAAFPKERMEYVIALCQLLGFEPSVVDLTADCVSRIYVYLSEKNNSTEGVGGKELSSTGDMAIVSMHSDQVEFVLLRAGHFFLHSDMKMDIGTLIERYEEKILPPKVESSTYSVDTENKESIYRYVNDRDEIADLEAYIGNEEGYEDDRKDFSSYIVNEELHKQTQAGSMDLSFYVKEEVKLSLPSNEDIESELKEGFSYSQEVHLEGMNLEIDFDNEDTIITSKDSTYQGIEELMHEPEKEVVVHKSGYWEEHDEASQEQTSQLQEEFKQSALNIGLQDDDTEEEFLLEDLFVPLEKLNNDMAAIIKADHPVNELGQWELENNEERIFDTLDLDKTLIGIEEKEYKGTEIEAKEELENNFSPVVNKLSELLVFFTAENSGHSVNSIYLTGEYSIYPYLAQFFQENLNIVTTEGLPNGWQPQIDKMAKNEEQEWQKYTCLLGLALRED